MAQQDVQLAPLCPQFVWHAVACICGLRRVLDHPGVLLSLFRQSVSSHLEQALQSGHATLPREAIADLLLVMVSHCLTQLNVLLILSCCFTRIGMSR